MRKFCCITLRFMWCDWNIKIYIFDRIVSRFSFEFRTFDQEIGSRFSHIAQHTHYSYCCVSVKWKAFVRWEAKNLVKQHVFNIRCHVHFVLYNVQFCASYEMFGIFSWNHFDRSMNENVSIFSRHHHVQILFCQMQMTSRGKYSRKTNLLQRMCVNTVRYLRMRCRSHAPDSEYEKSIRIWKEQVSVKIEVILFTHAPRSWPSK